MTIRETAVCDRAGPETRRASLPASTSGAWRCRIGLAGVSTKSRSTTSQTDQATAQLPVAHTIRVDAGESEADAIDDHVHPRSSRARFENSRTLRLTCRSVAVATLLIDPSNWLAGAGAGSAVHHEVVGGGCAERDRYCRAVD